jgi:hypothetical protein
MISAGEGSATRGLRPFTRLACAPEPRFPLALVSVKNISHVVRVRRPESSRPLIEDLLDLIAKGISIGTRLR